MRMRHGCSIVVECYGGPSTGKSVAAADMFAKLKRRHVDAEMAREFAKRYALSGESISALDELYILGSQVREETRLLGRVAVAVSDRPVLMSAVYTEMYSPSHIRDGVVAAVCGYYEESRRRGHVRVAVLLGRRHGYDERGRYEDAATAMLVDEVVRQVVAEEYDAGGVAAVYDLSPTGRDCEDDVVVDVARMIR